MCEQTYVGCPQCYRRSDSGEVFQYEYVTETVKYECDEDGEINRQAEPNYGEDHQYEHAGYMCECGWQGQSLDHECSDDACECDECDPDAAYTEGDEPEELVMLVRGIRCPYSEPEQDWPVEIARLFESRDTWCIAVPRWRGSEIFNDFLGVHGRLDVTIAFEPNAAAERLAYDYDHNERKVLTA